MRNKIPYFPIITVILAIAFLMVGCGKTNTIPLGTVNFQILVKDAENNPLSGAKVVSESQPAGQLKISGLTDNNGNVTFNSIRTGDYTLYVNRFDYNQIEIAITITPTNNNLTVNMTKTVTTTITPTTSPIPITFSQLVNQPKIYNDQFVTLEGFYFSGFEITALSVELFAATYNSANVSPKQPLIWITGNLGQNVYDNLYKQTNTPSGYPEYFGKIQITGQFHYGSKYGHLDAYKYQISAISGELLPWSPTDY
jgi:hypothetical protein